MSQEIVFLFAYLADSSDFYAWSVRDGTKWLSAIVHRVGKKKD